MPYRYRLHVSMTFIWIKRPLGRRSTLLQTESICMMDAYLALLLNKTRIYYVKMKPPQKRFRCFVQRELSSAYALCFEFMHEI